MANDQQTRRVRPQPTHCGYISLRVCQIQLVQLVEWTAEAGGCRDASRCVPRAFRAGGDDAFRSQACISQHLPDKFRCTLAAWEEWTIPVRARFFLGCFAVA